MQYTYAKLAYFIHFRNVLILHSTPEIGSATLLSSQCLKNETGGL